MIPEHIRHNALVQQESCGTRAAAKYLRKNNITLFEALRLLVLKNNKDKAAWERYWRNLRYEVQAT